MSVQVPRQTYVFREMLNPVPPTTNLVYKLEAIVSDHVVMEYDSGGIERSGLTDAELVHLQLLNSVCIAETNAEAVRFVFASRDHGSSTCTLTPTGQLRVVGYMPHGAPCYDNAAAQVPAEHGANAFHALSVFTTIHDYIETSTPGRYYHVGCSLLPCGTVFLPVWMNISGMRAFLGQWYSQKIPKAKAESRLAIRQANGESSIRHVIARESTPA